MKRSIIYKVFGIAALAFAAFGAISCTEEPTVEPIFPEMVTDYEIEPGQTIYLTFVPNMDWTVSIPEESYKWFKIKDGKLDSPTISGKAASTPVEITIQTNAAESFDLRSCVVTLTMGGQSKEIAKYMLKAIDRTLEVYPAVYTDGGFEYAEEEYVYATEPLGDGSQIRLHWSQQERRYYFPLKISSNCEWEVEWPTWARADIDVETRVSDVYVDVYGILSQLPMDDEAFGDIVFKSAGSTLKTITLFIPRSKDKFELNMSFGSVLNFDHLGYLHTSSGFSNDPIEGFFYGPEAARVLILEKTANGYQAMESSWVDFVLTKDWTPGADLLQQRNFTIDVLESAASEPREALVIFLPATVSEDEELFESGNLNAEYQQYAVTVKQKAMPSEYITFEKSGDLSKYGISLNTLEQAPDLGLIYEDGSANWNYELTYTKRSSSNSATYFAAKPFKTYEIYDINGVKIPEDDYAEFWLSYEDMSDSYYGCVKMDQSKINEKIPDVDENGEPIFDADGKPLFVPVQQSAYLVFKNHVGSVLATVKCTCVPERIYTTDVFRPVDASMFVDPDLALASGASISRLIGGPTYEKMRETTETIYYLTYTSDNTKLEINTTTELLNYVCYGVVPSDDQSDFVLANVTWTGRGDGPRMLLIDEAPFDNPDPDAIGANGFMLEWVEQETEEGYVGGYVGQYDGITSIRMTMPEETEGFVPVEMIQLFNSSNEVIMAIICELAIR